MFPPGQGDISGNSASGNWRNQQCPPPGNQKNPIGHGTHTPYEASPTRNTPSRVFFNSASSRQVASGNTPSGIGRINLPCPPARNQEIPNGRGTPVPSRNTPSRVSWNHPSSGQVASGTPSGMGRHLPFPPARNQEAPNGRGSSTPSRVHWNDPSSGQGGNSGNNNPSGIGRHLQFPPARNQETSNGRGTATPSRNIQVNQRQPNNFVRNGTTAIGGLRHQNAAPSAPLTARTPAPRFPWPECPFEDEKGESDYLSTKVEELDQPELNVPASQAQCNPPRCQSSGQDQFSSQTQNLIAEFNVDLQSVVRFRHLLGLAKVIYQMVATYHQIPEPFFNSDGFPPRGPKYSKKGIKLLWNIDFYSSDTKTIESIEPYFTIENANTRTLQLAYVTICSDDKDEKQALDDLRLKFRLYCAQKGIDLNIIRVLPFAWRANSERLTLPEELKDLPFNPREYQMLLKAVSTTVAPLTASHRVPKIFY